MRIREATPEDKATWDAFVDTEGGNFFHYFDWKHVYDTRGDQFIPLLAETSTSRWLGILPIVREDRLLYSVLHADIKSGIKSGGLLLKRNLSDAERYETISAFSQYVDTHYSRGCSRFTLRECLPPADALSEEPTAALLDNGFRFRYDELAHLPCTFTLELEQPFEENIWQGLWSRNLRKKLNKARRKGVVVIQDTEWNYATDFIDMVIENYERHGTTVMTREEITVTLNTFRDKARLFVALRDNQPIVASVCYYHVSTCFLAEIGSYSKDTEDANLLCYLAAIEDACSTGYKFADLGFTATSGLAYFKEQFKATRIPFRTYEKRYSVPRAIMELGPLVLKNAWQDKAYIWNKRRKLWDSILHW